jgi:hypothetical protein
MATRNHSQRSRGFRPEADVLEDRQLLSALVSGTDAQGDTWTLRLVGPGTVSVVKQADPTTGQPAALDSATDIESITIGGTNPLTSRLIGVVHKGSNPDSDGRVFFQTMNGLPSFSQQYAGGGLGLLSIDMPDFWLGNTTPTDSTTPPASPSIELPDGVDTFRFGGVDTTYNQGPASSASNTMATVRLGLPLFGGTRIIINKSISSTQTAPSATGGAPTVFQHGVAFDVAGRLQLFQANAIEGDAANPPAVFGNIPGVTNASGAGGTIVFSGTAGTTTFFAGSEAKGPVTGAIGDVRVGGNATNLLTVVNDATSSGNAKLSNFSVGGETSNVLLIAPNGARNLYFGKGMDTAEVYTHVINQLQANRGAINTNVYVDRTISRINFGGDVVNSLILSGVNQDFNTIFSAISGATTGTPSAPPKPLNATPFGGMTVHVAGDVNESVFAASVQPFTDASGNTLYGDPNQVVLTGGEIKAKVEGIIDNTSATPSTPSQAFFAQHVNLVGGPVVPPNVPEAPYPGNGLPAHLPGIHQGTQVRSNTSTARNPAANAGGAQNAKALHAKTSPLTLGKATPAGPARK